MMGTGALDDAAISEDVEVLAEAAVPVRLVLDKTAALERLDEAILLGILNTVAIGAATVVEITEVLAGAVSLVELVMVEAAALNKMLLNVPVLVMAMIGENLLAAAVSDAVVEERAGDSVMLTVSETVAADDLVLETTTLPLFVVIEELFLVSALLIAVDAVLEGPVFPENVFTPVEKALSPEDTLLASVAELDTVVPNGTVFKTVPLESAITVLVFAGSNPPVAEGILRDPVLDDTTAKSVLASTVELKAPLRGDMFAEYFKEGASLEASISVVDVGASGPDDFPLEGLPLNDRLTDALGGISCEAALVSGTMLEITLLDITLAGPVEVIWLEEVVFNDGGDDCCIVTTTVEIILVKESNPGSGGPDGGVFRPEYDGFEGVGGGLGPGVGDFGGGVAGAGPGGGLFGGGGSRFEGGGFAPGGAESGIEFGRFGTAGGDPEGGGLGAAGAEFGPGSGGYCAGGDGPAEAEPGGEELEPAGMKSVSGGGGSCAGDGPAGACPRGGGGATGPAGGGGTDFGGGGGGGAGRGGAFCGGAGPGGGGDRGSLAGRGDGGGGGGLEGGGDSSGGGCFGCVPRTLSP